MRRDTRIQLTAIACMVVCMGASAVLTPQISASVGRNRLVYADKAEAGEPPQVALGIAMGAFRGLFVNWLWMRANDLKEKGKYFEAVDLSRTITRLQPRFPKVWQFHAWNLAYNISVATQTPEERWNWVQAGIHLLRDEGIPANPQSLDLHRELAWIHLHKVQGYMDDAHRYYKTELAHEWSIVMGHPPTVMFDDMNQKGYVKQQYIKRWLEPLAQAADTLDDLYTAEPAAKELVEKMRAAGMQLDRRLLERFEVMSDFISTGLTTGIPLNVSNDALGALMMDDKYTRAGKALMLHLRKRMLIDEYHMEPERMIRYTQKYGPLDWRHPASHAVYWSARGSEETLLRVNEFTRKDYDILNTDRMTIQALQELYRTGMIMYDVINPEFYLAIPNTEFMDSYRQTLRELVDRSKFDDSTRVYKFYWAGYENFMRDAIRFLYRRGDKAAAAEYQKALYLDPDLSTFNPALHVELSRPLDDFVWNEIVPDERETNPTVALQEISGALSMAFFAGLGTGNDTLFRSSYDYARLFHAKFQDTQAFKTWITGENGRMGWPPFEKSAAQLLGQMISMAGMPRGPTMYRRAPVELQARTYAVLERLPMRQQIEAQTAAGKGPAFNVWFPEPAGIDAARAEMFPGDPLPNKGTTELK